MRNLSRPRPNYLDWKLKIILALFFFLLASQTRAAAPLDVVINEIAWMGTKISYNDEWIELYNNGDSEINLSGWKLIAKDGAPEINLEGQILAKSFYLLERTDDKTVPDIPADKIYVGSLGNNGEELSLFDNSGNLIDFLNCSAGWFAGDNQTKQTMERKDAKIEGNNSENWQDSQNPGGTPRAKNSTATEIETEPKEEVTTTQTIVYPSAIWINEILPSPEGPDEENEWIEIFNQNDFEVNLKNWQIKDTAGATKEYNFPEDKKIGAKGFLLLLRPETKITLNNDGDGLILLNPEGEIIDKVNYEKAPLGQSFSRTDSKWIFSTSPTPGKANVITQPEVKGIEKENRSGTQTTEVSDEVKKELAAISLKTPKENLKFFIFLTAIFVSFLSGGLILILKKKLKKLTP